MTLFSDGFSHYLGYGATDQQTLRDLAGKYDGLVVPGTIAAYQRQGTGGFVLSLSATQASPPYVIDSRFPLFQQQLRDPKQSHYALAEIFGYPDLVDTKGVPKPTDFVHDTLADMAETWVNFNDAYHRTESSAFAKYAKRLDEPLQIDRAKRPERVLAPYFMADGRHDPWWDLCDVLWAATRTAAGERATRVVAAKGVEAFSDLLSGMRNAQIVIWVSHLDETTTGYRDLRSYAQTLENASERGIEPFALYGGFFHVLMRKYGLTGHSHGVGFGEYRTWQELPQSGPPPARYYLRRAHRFVPQDLANQLALQDPSLTECPCAECRDRLPLEMSYHQLMRHSVAARAEEIARWKDVAKSSVAELLRGEHEALERQIRRPRIAPPVQRTALRYIEQLETWADAFDPPSPAI